MTCTQCGLDHSGPCQAAIRAYYEGRIAELREALKRTGKHIQNLSTYHYPDTYLEAISREIDEALGKGE
jgi:hypothetical protein